MAPTVLVVDDEHTIVHAVASLLGEEGYAVRVAYDGAEALRAVGAAPVDLIVSDVAMPHLDGLTLTNRLRQRGDRTPVVLMSAAAADVDLPDVRFVPKPFDLDDLVWVVARACAGDGC